MIVVTWMAMNHCLNLARCDTIHVAPQKNAGRNYVDQGRLAKKQVTTRPGNMWQEAWTTMSKGSQQEAINKWAEERPEVDAAREPQGMYFLPDEDPDYEEVVK